MGNRYSTICLSIAFALLFIALRPGRVAAQTSVCPSGTTSYGVLHGTYTDDVETCFQTDQRLFVFFSGAYFERYPCEQSAVVDYEKWFDEFQNNIDFPADDLGIFYGVPESRSLGATEARVRFYMFFPSRNGLVTAPTRINGQYRIEYFDSSRRLFGVVTGELDDLSIRIHEHPFFGIGTRYTNIYLVDEMVPVTGPGGGFFRFSMRRTSGEPWNISTGYASVQISQPDTIFPAQCSIDGPFLGFTPTPTSTPETPLPTPFATSGAVETIEPSPTLTPFTFSTLPPQPLPTRVTIPTIPPIVFPTLVPIRTQIAQIQLSQTPTVTPTVTTTPAPTIDSPATVAGVIGEMATRYAGQIELSESYLSITATNGISSTVEGVENVAAGIALPFRLYKAIEQYSPNTWPFYRTVLICAGIVFTMRVWRIALSLLITIVEVIRKIWEAIPFN